MGGAVAPTPAPALSAGPVPYPVMLGSDPGVISFPSNFCVLHPLNAFCFSDRSHPIVTSNGMVRIPFS